MASSTIQSAYVTDTVNGAPNSISITDTISKTTPPFGSVVDFIDHWQTLTGSALGVTLPITFSLVGFWIKSRRNKRQELKENLRRVEISTSRTLDDAVQTINQLKIVIKLIDARATATEAIDDMTTVVLDQVNFPVTGEIYRDSEAPMLKIGSYYIHNKLIILDSRLKSLNKILSNLKEESTGLVEHNRFLVSLGKLKPAELRKIYAENLRSFLESLQYYSDHTLPGLIRHTIEIKNYNRRLRKNFRATRKEFEKTMDNDGVDIDSLEKIDNEIKPEVDIELKNLNERLDLLRNTQIP